MNTAKKMTHIEMLEEMANAGFTIIINKYGIDPDSSLVYLLSENKQLEFDSIEQEIEYYYRLYKDGKKNK